MPLAVMLLGAVTAAFAGSFAVAGAFGVGAALGINGAALILIGVLTTIVAPGLRKL